jgi:general secretion pathway protein J
MGPVRTVADRGFTLLELLVALALLVILSGALYGTYFSLMRGRETAVAKMAERREVSVTLDQLRREISAVFFNKQNLQNLKENLKPRFVVEDRDFFGKPASTLDFTALAPPRGDALPASDQVRITYRPVEKEGKIILARQARDRYTTIEPLPYPQMEALEGFLVECSADGAKWVRSWDTALNFGLPRYVRITLRVKEGEKSLEFSTVAEIKVWS